jgi:hypothetical protein
MIVGNGVSTETDNTVGIRCQETPSEKIEDLVRAIMNCIVSRLARELKLLVVRSF